MYTPHAEMKAGIVVLVALAVLLGFLYLVSGEEGLWAKKREIRIRFEQGFAAPKEGDPVLMNGVKIGRISEVVQREERRTGAEMTDEDRARLKLKPGEEGVAREIYVLAVARLPTDQVIPEGTTAQISVSLTGTRTLALLPGRSTTNLTDEDTARRPIPATSAGDLTDVQRSVQNLVDRVADLVDKGNVTLDDVRGLITTVQHKVEAIEVDRIQGNVLEATQSLKEALASAKVRLEEIAAKISAAASNVETMSADGSKLVRGADADLHEISGALKEILAELKGIVVRAGPKVDLILADVADAARSAKALGADLQSLGPKVRALLGDTAGDFDSFLTSMNEVGHNLQDASEDLRAHPWKLLNKPDEAEIAFENLRNATQNFVAASARIERTTKELNVLLARTDLPESDVRTRAQELLARLRADQDKYSEAEQQFRRLLQQGGGPPGRIPK